MTKTMPQTYTSTNNDNIEFTVSFDAFLYENDTAYRKEFNRYEQQFTRILNYIKSTAPSEPSPEIETHETEPEQQQETPPVQGSEEEAPEAQGSEGAETPEVQGFEEEEEEDTSNHPFVLFIQRSYEFIEDMDDDDYTHTQLKDMRKEFRKKYKISSPKNKDCIDMIKQNFPDMHTRYVSRFRPMTPNGQIDSKNAYIGVRKIT